MKKLLLPLVIAIAAALGGGGGYLAKTKLNASPGAEKSAHADNARDDSSHGSKTKKSKGHGESDAADAPAYMKFSRQFVVPIVKGGAPRLMMILDINIAVDDALAEKVYQYEPQLRDAMLQALLNLASESVLENAAVDETAMNAVKERLLETARSTLGDGAQGILIQDIGLQAY